MVHFDTTTRRGRFRRFSFRSGDACGHLPGAQEPGGDALDAALRVHGEADQDEGESEPR